MNSPALASAIESNGVVKAARAMSSGWLLSRPERWAATATAPTPARVVAGFDLVGAPERSSSVPPRDVLDRASNPSVCLGNGTRKALAFRTKSLAR
jgi:hypothetical protein